MILKRQVSTQPEKVRAFFAGLAQKAGADGGFLAILEICGMNDWLVKMLQEYGCREIVVVQPTERAKQKTDRRDAGDLAHLLWIHRQQFLDGKHPLGLRRVQWPTPQEAEDRQLTSLRVLLTRRRTAVLNGIHKLLRKHNIEQSQPTKGFKTKRCRIVAGGGRLPTLDRLEMNLLFPQWELLEQQLKAVDEKIASGPRPTRAYSCWRRCRAWPTTSTWRSIRGSAMWSVSSTPTAWRTTSALRPAAAIPARPRSVWARSP